MQWFNRPSYQEESKLFISEKKTMQFPEIIQLRPRRVGYEILSKSYRIPTDLCHEGTEYL